jgi:hypothetical protein
MAVNLGELHKALLDAFQNPGEFQVLISGMGKPWAEFSGGGISDSVAISNAIARAASDGWINDLLHEVAASSKSKNPLFVRFLAKYPEVDPKKAPAAPPDPYQATTMIANRPFVGRKPVRQYLKLLGTAKESRVLLVNGPVACGKSYTHDFIQYLATHTPGRIRYLNLDAESLTLEKFLLRLKEKLGLPEPPASDTEQDARWAERLVSDWLLAYTANDPQGRSLWLVFDGFARQEHARGVHDLLDKLCEMVDGEAASEASHIRIVLLNYGDHRTPPTVYNQAFVEAIKTPTEDDFKALFEERHLARGLTREDAKLAFDEVYQQAQAKQASDAAKRPLLYWINIGTTGAIKALNL